MNAAQKHHSETKPLMVSHMSNGTTTRFNAPSARDVAVAAREERAARRDHVERGERPAVCLRVDVVVNVVAFDRRMDRAAKHRDGERGRDREAEHAETAHDPPARRRPLDQADRDGHEHG